MRKRKQGEVSVYLPKELLNAVDDFAKTLLISRSAAIRIMVKDYFQSSEQKASEE